ncbi:hypothetical protein [Pseudodesulfovibrio senegalensis]|jgi:hypothetical protein|uniref:Uncharacterized protein n=1 Tax=Pseudodesulfovibrio senegalensis TaxID=1721087 RepID=A0A6N6N6R3_9BACT|nr:hypothetical protein [Pseudodesulfovibrio senegalensis]KAB1443165.1 hypothetical protein F8A88_02555 [Pseudodesulfovibrio senegalensis]
MQPIQTKYGDLIPQHTTDDLRKKEVLPVRYHENGTPKTVPLEMQTSIPTPVGNIPAELVTFHENGTLKRVFPLNGKLSGYWGESDEAALAEPTPVQTPAGMITAKVIAISFHENEAIRSLTLWPGEVVSLVTPVGPMKARIGISFDRNGMLRSLEPASPTSVTTPIGDIMAFNSDALGVNGDMNSLVFDARGAVARVTTTLSQLSVVRPNGESDLFKPLYRESYCSETEQEPVPMIVAIGKDTITIQTHCDLPTIRIPTADHVFLSESPLPRQNTIPLMGCGL